MISNKRQIADFIDDINNKAYYGITHVKRGIRTEIGHSVDQYEEETFEVYDIVETSIRETLSSKRQIAKLTNEINDKVFNGIVHVKQHDRNKISNSFKQYATETYEVYVFIKEHINEVVIK